MNRCRSYLALSIIFTLLLGACGSAESPDSGQPGPATPTSIDGPTTTPPSTESVLECDFGISDAIEQFASIDELSWFSNQIVVATVTDKLESRKVPGGPTPEVPYYIVTDYVLRVDQRMRGSDTATDKTLTIRSWGGTIDGCTQIWEDWPPFKIGNQALFFLRDFEEANPVTYDIFGRNQGYWEIDESGQAAPPNAVHLLPAGQRIPVGQLIDMVRNDLADGPPPAGYLRDQYLVQLDEAPIVSDDVEWSRP